MAHGFRSSLRNWAAEETDHPREVIEAALAQVARTRARRPTRGGAALLRWRPNQSLRRRRGRRQLDPSRRGEERRRGRWPTVLLSSATDGGLPLVLARFVRGLSTHQGSGCLRRLRTAATAAKCHRAPVDSHRVADQMPTGPSMSRRQAPQRRVAAATWMMSSTTVASRAYAVVPARRSRWSRGGASRPSSAPAAGSARHRADASRRDRAARSPDPQPASCRRSFRRGFRARAAPSTRYRWCPRPDQQPLSGCVGRDVLAGACVPNPGAAGAVPVRVRSRSSAGLRWTRGRLWHPRRQHRPLRTGLGSGDRCKGRRFAARRMYVPGILSSQPSQVCLPSHGTVPERRANVQKGARPRGTDRRCSVPFRGSAGRRKDAGTRWLGCCPPERSTGETHPRAKRPMNRAKTPLRRRAAPNSGSPPCCHVAEREELTGMTSWSYLSVFSHRRGDTPCHCRPVAAAPSTEKRSAFGKPHRASVSGGFRPES